MRPHKLVMKAFGPFAGETVVDFDAMGNSIYLISGDTGAGKTTIFDGIIYALYGTASGSARSNLGTEAFHSDYAKSGKHRDEMRVELTFSNAGRTYTVARRMYWGKKGEAQKAEKEAVLSENGNTITFAKGKEDTDDVSKKITEILGLDAVQFRRIIMLAQGEFQRFLTAKSDERGDILGKLYDNRQHQDFQQRLKAASMMLKARDNAVIGEANAQFKVFVYPETTGEESPVSAVSGGQPASAASAGQPAAAFSIDQPDLLPSMQAVIGRIETAAAALGTAIQEKEAGQKDLEEQKTKGQTWNGMLKDLEKKRLERASLEETREATEALRLQVRLTEAAEKVLPAEKAMRQAGEDYAGVLDKIRSLEEKRGQLEKQVISSRETAEETEKENTPKIAGLKEQAAAVFGILHFYDDLEESTRVLTGRKKTLKEAEKAAGQAEKQLKQHKERLQELEGVNGRLAGAGESAVSLAQKELDDCIARKDELEAAQSSKAAVEKLIREEEKLKAALASAQREALAAEEKHLQLNRAFIQGQAGILAQDLRTKLQTQPEAVCPVCGTRHTRDTMQGFAAWHDEIPVKEDVDNAYTAWDSARQTVKTAEEAHTAKANELSGQMQALLTKTAGLISVSDWDTLAGSTALADALRACKMRMAETRAAYNQAAADWEAKKNAEAEKKNTEELVSAAERALEDARQQLSEAAGAVTAAEERAANWKQQLAGYPETKAEAKELIASLEKKAGKLQKQIDETRDQYAAVQKAQAANAGNLEGAYSEKAARSQAKTDAETAFSAQLAKQGFADAGAFHDALSPEGRLLDAEGAAAWLKESRAEIEEADQKRRDLDAKISQLASSTQDMHYVDIAAIEAQIAEVSVGLGRMRSEEKALASRLQTDRRVYDAVSDICEKHRQYLRAMKKLGPLVDTADGKYAFSRYVLTGFFHRIVEQANIHLDTMTDGEYCLVPKETGDGRTNIGLDFKVLNTITNLERDTASLSGGQLFEASLSLALGLSDVVQMESTSRIQIDSMFIDEGFGSLDGTRLDKSIEVLQHLSAGKRQIGIISHVARLDECLPKKIRVIAGSHGSSVVIDTDA